MAVINIHINHAIAKAVAENALIIDIRSQREFMEGHIPMSIHVPQEQILSGHFNLPKSKMLIVYCATGSHSMVVSRYLDRRGYRVVNALGGIRACNRALTSKH